MKRILFTLLAILSLSLTAWSKNTVASVNQVTSSVTISNNEDYTITGTTPFGTSGSVNITNTDHAVVIIQKYKPSQVKASYLSKIKINGTDAKDGTNCQVRMYGTGTIILPYSSTLKPLTCYSGQDYSGTSYTNYGTGNTGGFMNTLTSSNGLNNIRSFKLKRGYMVTFATGTAGWGYSRCFIADQEDLEMNLPPVLSGKVSSYRIFKWHNAQKKGVGGNSDTGITSATNASWSFTWGAGASQAPDVEFVPHKIHKDWPGVSEIGGASYSPHAKTDNEPANSADDVPATVDQVLGYWQDMMRTGMRLCSPSSHDGGYTWLEQFMRAIDERGWRCDILDMHCYWASGSFSSLKGYYDKYKRPIWISELMWGASWNHNGIFSVSNPGSNSTENQTTLYNGAKPIVDALNGYDYVERYAWWNDENVASKILYNGTLTKFGEYYASMNSGLAYKKAYEFVPVVVIKNPYDLKTTITSHSIAFSWKDVNGDMVDNIRIEYKAPNATSWNILGTLTPKDKTGSGDQSYSFSKEVENADQCTFRVVDIFDGKLYSSPVIYPATTATYITDALPAQLDQYFFMFHSKEASTDLVWSVANNNVYYQQPNATPGKDLSQLWIIEDNSANGGFSLRNLSTPDYLMCTPNSWDFITNNAEYKIAAAKTSFLPEFKDDYCVWRNVAHKTYVGLWDNDKNFGAGERLAGNRTNFSGNDSGDKVLIYAIPRSQVYDVINSSVNVDWANLKAPAVPGVNPNTWTGGKTTPIYIYNVETDAFLTYGMSWGTNAIATRLNNGDTSDSDRHQMYLTSTNGIVNLVSKNFSDKFVGTEEKANEVWIDFTANKDWYALAGNATNTYKLAHTTKTGKLLDVSYDYGGHLTVVDGKGHTEWAFIPASNVSNGAYALYKVRKSLYAILSAMEQAGMRTQYADAMTKAAKAYLGQNMDAKALTQATRELLLAAGGDLPSQLDVSALFDNADIVGTKGIASWTQTEMPLSFSEYECYHKPFELKQTLTDAPKGYYRVKFHSLVRLDNGDAAPKLTLTGDETKQTSIPTITSLDWDTNDGNNGWKTSNGKAVPDNMLSCGQALSHEGAVAVTDWVPAKNGNLTVQVKVTSSNQWVNLQGFSIEYAPVSDFEMPGDITVDGKIDTDDVLALSEAIMGKPKNALYNYDAADLNKDGRLSIADLTLLIKRMLTTEN